jgi:hypothetical protein
VLVPDGSVVLGHSVGSVVSGHFVGVVGSVGLVVVGLVVGSAGHFVGCVGSVPLPPPLPEYLLLNIMEVTGLFSPFVTTLESTSCPFSIVTVSVIV